MSLRPATFLAAAAIAACVPTATPAEDLRVAGLFADHMVLQRGKPVPVWGWADPGTEVTVSARGQSASATADPDGRWTAELAPLKVGKPFTVTVQGDGTAITFDDVLAGEVWLCGGQSNMQWTVAQSNDAAAEIAAADLPQIRVALIPRTNQPAPLKDIAPATWKVCSPKTAGGFTAVGYFFGRQLHETLDVPVGLIDSNWGGTPIEAWTSAQALKPHPDFTARVEAIEAFTRDAATVARGKQQSNAWAAARWKAFSDKDDSWKAADLDDSDWGTLNVPGAWETQGYPEMDGTVWYRRTVDVPDTHIGQEATLAFGWVDQTATAYLNGAKLPGDNRNKKPHVFSVPAGALNTGSNTIAVRVSDLDGPGGLLGDDHATHLAFADDTRIPLAGAWKARPTEQTAQLDPPAARVFFDKNQDTGLYNAMIHPLVPYALRGVVWYQGESNAGRARQYRDLFPRMIHDWRARWGESLPFYWVQLANFRGPAKKPGPSGWAQLREAQSMTLSLPHTGQAVAIDIGEAWDIHPRNKQDVGARLARIALAQDYGRDVAYSGPAYRSMAVEGDRVRLTFEHAEGLTNSGGPLQRFEIAGADKVFVWANTQVDGDSVVVHSPAVAEPVAVRYAWADNPEGCNLINAAGLPASPFRTDVD